MGLDCVGSPPGRTVLAAVTGRWLRAQPGRIAVLPGAGPPRAGGRSLTAGTSALMWAPHLVIHGNPVSPPSRRAWGKVTAWLFFRRRDHRHGRAPWPGPHRGPASRAAHARGARAGPSAGGYGSAALFLISPVGHPSRGADSGRPGPGGPAAACSSSRPAHFMARVARWKSSQPGVSPGWRSRSASGRSDVPGRHRKSSKEIREAVSDRGRGVRSRGERPPTMAAPNHRR